LIIFGRSFFEKVEAPISRVVSTSDMSVSGGYTPSVFGAGFDGEKFEGGLGGIKNLFPDYWTLRARSAQLFNENPYAKGVIRRLITAEINTGLMPESMPIESILGLEEDELDSWTDDVEKRFWLWANNPKICDYESYRTFAEIEQDARREALVTGDVLVIIRQDKKTGLPSVQLIPGDAVRTTISSEPVGSNEIIEGVEINSKREHVAYHVCQEDGTSRRVPAFGRRSGRRLAFLYYGTEKRAEEVRGQPILSVVLQPIKEIDRYRDSAQRKAVVNSIIAMFMKKTEDKAGTRPLTGGARRVETIDAVSSDEASRSYTAIENSPGLIMQELQVGEEPVAFQSNGADDNFPDFEESIVSLVCWALEIPPEIGKLSFSSNYSASQAANNEFKSYLDRTRDGFGASFCQPIYIDFLTSEVSRQKISAPGLVESLSDPNQYDILGAWVNAEWSGAIKPSVDPLKLVKAYNEMVEGGFISRTRVARELTGTKYSQNIKRLRKENEELAAANAPTVGLMGSAVASVIIDEGVEDERSGKQSNT